MSNQQLPIHIVGAGLAGSECAYQLATMGHKVVLHEMRPNTMTPAHKTNGFAELVCSNSFGSMTDYSAPGQLKWEAEKLGSLVLTAAHQARVPAGMSLSVDRTIFSNFISEKLKNHPNITISNEVVNSLEQVPRPTVIATGPLTHKSLAESMQNHFGKEFLYFYDAIAPIVDADSINTDIAWKADRWDNGTKDYYNCPLDKEQYENLVKEIINAKKVELKEFEKTPYFEGCMPIEAIVDRGPETLRFGPLSPKGLRNPKTGRWPWAVVQLRQDNREATAYNLVGFQTKMTYGEQARVLKMIPGLENAEFLKFGSIHRNLFINSPKLLNHDLSSKKDPMLFFAGQIAGVEGYFESTCIGLLVAHFLHQKTNRLPFSLPPRATAMGSLLYAITQEEKEDFQPTNINFSLFPLMGLDSKVPKKEKRQRKITLAQNELLNWQRPN
ncbi:MAG: methylenetetrahydrofolate--tRNA-(uracil(54)-C(5))-methyltransferase (FADH(2)-oxidizing) TrmFO [Proteobacteria bacterium SG_bin7]|nr:MAG: methylenetetrahydrofolate--tRNA-(uracil(54)-C(5))-methyltransferase (FADH(2)-oxidizing) TrmFO [Proteobacteria bacterium SG_bin7]